MIELTEDYPTVDFRFVHESLMLYRSMGFRVAIDDLGEGFASLRLWSELRPEYVKADKHFVRGIAADPVKLQFLRAIQHIAESSGSQVIAEGIENAEDFRVAKDIGIACGQGWFIGRPSERPTTRLPAEAEARVRRRARAGGRAAPRLRAGTEPSAHDFVRAVDAGRAAGDRIAARARALRRVARAHRHPGHRRGRARRAWSRARSSSSSRRAPRRERLLARPCIEFADEAPIRVEAEPRPGRAHRAAGRVRRAPPRRRLRDRLAGPLPRHGHERAT